MLAFWLSAFLATLTLQAPAQHSAQCLTEVAAMSGQRLDLLDARMRAAASAKVDALMAAHRSVTLAYSELREEQETYLASVPAQIAAGELPPGSEAVLQRQFEEESSNGLRAVRRSRDIAPSCDWPALPTERPLPQAPLS